MKSSALSTSTVTIIKLNTIKQLNVFFIISQPGVLVQHVERLCGLAQSLLKK